MPKKVTLCFLLCLTLLLTLGACSISGTENLEGITTAAAVTATVPATTKPAQFVDDIPEYTFNNYVDAYDTDTTYSFTVSCSQEEYDSYFALLLNCGYSINATQDGARYNADNPNGYNVNVNFNGTELLVAFTKN